MGRAQAVREEGKEGEDRRQELQKTLHLVEYIHILLLVCVLQILSVEGIVTLHLK
jgi:hypothetical protein